jgi:hypothetical protein
LEDRGHYGEARVQEDFEEEEEEDFYFKLLIIKIDLNTFRFILVYNNANFRENSYR